MFTLPLGAEEFSGQHVDAVGTVCRGLRSWSACQWSWCFLMLRPVFGVGADVGEREGIGGTAAPCRRIQVIADSPRPLPGFLMRKLLRIKPPAEPGAVSLFNWWETLSATGG